MRFLRPLGFLLLLGSAPAVAALANLGSDDGALIKHIKATDHIMKTSLGACHSERLSRSTRNDAKVFRFTASCQIRPLPKDDCPSYKVTATGTVDTPSWATVRDMRLELECTDGD
jgi:hypothetical protein